MIDDDDENKFQGVRVSIPPKHEGNNKMYGAKIIFENRKSCRIPVKFAALASTSRRYP